MTMTQNAAQHNAPFPGIPTDAWMDALVQVTRDMRDTYPEDSARIEKAAYLVLDGQVTLNPDGSAEVRSSTSTHTYYVNGACQCPDYRHGHTQCKHRYSRALAKRVRELTIHLRADRRYDTEARDQRCAAGSLVGKVCNGKVGEVVSQYKGVTEVHPVGWRGINGGQFEQKCG